MTRQKPFGSLFTAKPAAGMISVTRAIDVALREKGKAKRPSYVADLERDGNDSSVGCLLKSARRSTRLPAGRQAVSDSCNLHQLPSEISFATFCAVHVGGVKHHWSRIHAGESKLKAPRKAAANDFADFELWKLRSGRDGFTEAAKMKRRPGGRSSPRFHLVPPMTGARLSRLAALPGCVLTNRPA